MAVEQQDALHESPPPTPAPPDLSARAAELVRRHPECFWFWHPDTLAHPEDHLRDLQDVRLVIERLRRHGDRTAWREAQDLHKCLSPSYRKTS